MKRRPSWRMGWARLVCAFLGHDYDEDNYVKGSWKLACKRCDHNAVI